MGPEFHLQLISERTSRLRAEAADYRRAREVQVHRESTGDTSAKRRRGLFGKIISS
ncbi:hypothetical protein [Streptosporangium longisporum]|uniref:Uncharacterized protein n=1 Tax=Streptosporangium longisporum TaxID=46187 RepID=A0ABN3XU31_9ACTN